MSTAIPYALDQVVLTAVGRGHRGLMLAQRPTLAEAAGIALVMVALVISARDDRAGRAPVPGN